MQLHLILMSNLSKFCTITAAYSFSMGLAGVIGGRLADIYLNQTKSVVIISILIMALGNLQYAFGISITNIIIARLLCGN